MKKYTGEIDMLHANELMVGDWVKVTDDDTDDSFIGQVKAIDELENVNVPEGEDVAYPYSIDCIEPIPLTPEILEKNGWKHDPSMERLIIDCKLFIDRERWMSWDSKYHCLNITIRDSKQLSQYNLKELRLDVPCTNVHELQHALRLCGIEKEITL